MPQGYCKYSGYIYPYYNVGTRGSITALQNQLAVAAYFLSSYCLLALHGGTDLCKLLDVSKKVYTIHDAFSKAVHTGSLRKKITMCFLW